MRADEATEPIEGTFPGQVASVPLVRAFVASQLGDDWPGLDDVLLLVSEISANAVRHTASGSGGWFRVALSMTGLTARIEVSDDGGSSRPKVADSSEDAGIMTGGRGLRIVDVLADRWGHCGDELGRVVWFEVTGKPER